MTAVPRFTIKDPKHLKDLKTMSMVRQDEVVEGEGGHAKPLATREERGFAGSPAT